MSKSMPFSFITRAASLACSIPTSVKGTSHQPVKVGILFHKLCPCLNRTTVDGEFFGIDEAVLSRVEARRTATMLFVGTPRRCKCSWNVRQIIVAVLLSGSILSNPMHKYYIEYTRDRQEPVCCAVRIILCLQEGKKSSSHRRNRICFSSTFY